jgi:ATP-binding cassette, subfamily B, bacterial PglK
MQGYLTRFFYVLSGRRRQLALLMAFAVLSSVLEAFGLGMVGPFIAVATDAERNKPLIDLMTHFLSSVGVQNPRDYVLVLLGGSVIIAFYVKSILSFSVQRYIHEFGAMQRRWIAARLMYSYSRAPYTYHLKHNSAELVQTVVNETEVFSQMALLPLLFAVSNVLIILAIVTLLMITNAFAVFAVAGIVGVSFGLLQQFKTRIGQWGRDRNESFEESIRILNDSFGGVKEIRVLGCEPYFEQQVDREFKRYAISGSSFYAFSNLPRYMMEAFLITFLVLFTWAFLAFDKGNSGSLNSVLGIFAMSSIRLLPCVGTVVNGTSQVRYAGSALDKIYLALKELEALPDNNIISLRSSPETWMGSRPTPSPMTFEKQVEVSDITYHYPEIVEPALDQISFTFQRGEAIALIGRSGAGKTTLVDLILGLLTPASGDIKVDGVSIYGQLQSWQQLVGYVPQSIYLTEDTLLRNIAFGVPDHLVNHEQMQKALEAAQLVDLVKRLPQGINTMVGERGMRLSGGQRQRVGIARALYHDRQILVLDEATAALDNETESLVSDAVKALGGQKTLIIIAHRLTTIQHCDRVYLMESGRIIQTGSYESVVVAQGLATELDKAVSER